MSKHTSLLNHFVQDEYDAQLKLRREMWRQPVARRADSCEAIGNITIVEYTRDTATLELVENSSQFTTGDALRLSRDDPDGTFVGCILESEDGALLTVSPGPLQSFRKLKRGSGWTLDRDLVDHRQPLIAALDMLSAGSSMSVRSVQEIFDGAKPDVDAVRAAQARPRVARLPLEVKQREAVIQGMTTSNYWVVAGAPTTGKTYTLVYLAVTLAREGRRVLITGPDHRTINHALALIAEQAGPNPVCKIGDPNRTEGLEAAGRVRIYENFTASALHPTDRGLLIGALPVTPHLDDSLAAVEFDAVLFDDAERIGLPQAVSAMLSGRRYIFFGDPAGSPPAAYGKHREPWVTQSILQYVAAHMGGAHTSLDSSFTMNAQVLNFPNKNFYKRRLRPSPKVTNRQLQLAVKPPWPKFQQVLHPTHSSVFVETKHAGNDVISPDEARVAAWIVVVLTLGCKFPPEQVAALSPYRAQARLIRTGAIELAESRKQQLPDGVLFGTPEDMRHETRDLVIVSLATSDLNRAHARGDDYFSLSRLDLALTRAAVKRIVIGSPSLLNAKPPADRGVIDWLSLVRQLAEESERVLLKVKEPTSDQD